MFLLRLNPVTGNAEQFVTVARAETVEALLAFIRRESVPGYHDGGFWKVFRQGGPLEHYNPPGTSRAFFDAILYAGTLEERLEEATDRVRKDWAEMLRQVPEAS
jgi:hypothetical protein